MGPVSDFIATEARFGARNYEPLGVVLSRGEGVWVWDTQGNRYLDRLSGLFANTRPKCRLLGVKRTHGTAGQHFRLRPEVDLPRGTLSSAKSDLSINPAQTFLYLLSIRFFIPIRCGSRVRRESTRIRGDLAKWL
jgi:hypothetical protein